MNVCRRLVHRHFLPVAVIVALSSPAGAATTSIHVKGSGTHSKSHASAPKKAKKKKGHASTVTAAPHRSNRCESCDRDSKGRIVRSKEAKKTFMKATGFPHGRPGYVIDHIKPLACGGADVPSNMQWQTVAAAKAKDRVERIGCR